MSSCDLGLTPDCGFVLATTSLSTYGDHVCRLTADRKNLIVSLGSSSTVATGDHVHVLGNVLYPFFSGTFGLASGAFNVTISDNLTGSPGVTAVVRAPEVTALCADLSFWAGSSVGSAGRDLVFAWSFGSATPSDMHPYLQDDLDAANNIGAARLFFQAASVYSAVEHTNSEAITVDVVVTNWLGENDTASATVQIGTSTDPIPSITAVGSTTLVVNSSDMVSLLVKTGVAHTNCESNAESVLEQVVVLWEWRLSNSSGWSTLVDANLTDDDSSLLGVEFPAYSFDFATRHEIRASATLASGGDPASVVFYVQVASMPAPVPILDGPSTASPDCAFTLNASRSYDPSEPDASLSFLWSCSSNGVSCDLTNFGAANAGSTDGSGLVGSTFVVHGGELDSGEYTFQVEVATAETSEVGTQSVVVSNGAIVAVLMIPWTLDESLSAEFSLSPYALVQNSGLQDCVVPDSYLWRWALVWESTSSIHRIFSSTSATVDSTVEVDVVSFNVSDLIPGEMYTLALMVIKSSADLVDFVDSPPQTKGEAVSRGFFVASSVAFRADAAPSSGSIMMSRESGIAITDSFPIWTTGWVDEDVSPDNLTLQYAFYLFPGSVSTTAIEWDFVDGDSYWSTLGGVLLRTWSVDPEFTIYSMTAGSFCIAARAMDTAGGVGQVFKCGVTVSEATTYGLTDFLTVSADAVATNDPNVILGASLAWSSVLMEVSDTAVQDVIDLVVGAWEKAISVSRMSVELLLMVATVISEFVHTTGSLIDSSTRLRAMLVLGEAISSGVSDLSGVSKEEGTALLDSIASIQVGAADESLTSAALQVVSSLGSGVGLLLSVGATEALSSIANGSGIEIQVTRQSSSEAFEFSDVSVPAVSRRLQTCSEIEVQVTSWVSSNPYAYAIGGFNDQVLANANVTNVELFRCGLTLSSTVDPLSVVIVSDPGTAPDGESWHALCLLWNSSASSWSDSLVEVSSTNDTSATCQALNGGLAGSYTVIWNSWSVNGTTTTAEEESAIDESDSFDIGILALIVGLVAFVLLCCIPVVLLMMRCHRQTPAPVPARISSRLPTAFVRRWLQRADKTREDKYWEYGDAFEKRFPDAETLSAAVYRTSPTRVLNECGVVNVEDREVLHEALSMHAHTHVPKEIPEQEPYVEPYQDQKRDPHRDPYPELGPHHEKDPMQNENPSKLRQIAKDTSETAGNDRMQDAFYDVESLPPQDFPKYPPRMDDQSEFPWLPSASGRGLPHEAGIINRPRQVKEGNQPPAPQWGSMICADAVCSACCTSARNAPPRDGRGELIFDRPR